VSKSSTLDTPCVCRVCGKDYLVSFIRCTFHGWPRCCGRQVRMLSTTCDIDQGIGDALAPVRAEIARALRGES
jgi:hypothetical protein